MTTIYRACDGYTGIWSCWAECREDAEAYTDNPGFGGSQIVECEASAEHCLDVVDCSWTDFARELEFDDPAEVAAKWRDNGYGWLHDVIENDGEVRRRLKKWYDWVRHNDESYPEAAIVWVKTH